MSQWSETASYGETDIEERVNLLDTSPGTSMMPNDHLISEGEPMVGDTSSDPLDHADKAALLREIQNVSEQLERQRFEIVRLERLIKVSERKIAFEEATRTIISDWHDRRVMQLEDEMAKFAMGEEETSVDLEDEARLKSQKDILFNVARCLRETGHEVV